MSNFLKDVDIYYINMEKDIERNQYIINHFNINGINNALRIDAVDGQKEKQKINELSLSESGCSFSHLKAIKYFYENSNKDFAMICEDDLDINNIQKINFNFYDTLKYHNPEHYCLQLSCVTRTNMEINFTLRLRSFWDFTTTAYIINKKYAKVILDSYHSNISISNNFISKLIDDPRGHTVKTRPVADELIYSLCDTYVLPIFTVKQFKSSINDNQESYDQTLHSIDLFNDNWSKHRSIGVEVFKNEALL